MVKDLGEMDEREERENNGREKRKGGRRGRKIEGGEKKGRRGSVVGLVADNREGQTHRGTAREETQSWQVVSGSRVSGVRR